jgi:DNA-directed RNA polymerase specialized sigma24 family protein
MAVRNGKVRQPECLAGFVRAVVLNRGAGRWADRIRGPALTSSIPVDAISDHSQDPERAALDHEADLVIMLALRALPRLDREIITRYYLREEPAEKICADLG